MCTPYKDISRLAGRMSAVHFFIRFPIVIMNFLALFAFVALTTTAAVALRKAFDGVPHQTSTLENILIMAPLAIVFAMVFYTFLQIYHSRMWCYYWRIFQIALSLLLIGILAMSFSTFRFSTIPTSNWREMLAITCIAVLITSALWALFCGVCTVTLKRLEAQSPLLKGGGRNLLLRVKLHAFKLLRKSTAVLFVRQILITSIICVIAVSFIFELFAAVDLLTEIITERYTFETKAVGALILIAISIPLLYLHIRLSNYSWLSILIFLGAPLLLGLIIFVSSIADIVRAREFTDKGIEWILWRASIDINVFLICLFAFRVLSNSIVTIFFESAPDFHDLKSIGVKYSEHASYNLYLRTFASDADTIDTIPRLKNISTNTLGSLQGNILFEEVIVDQVFRHGPVVALSNPLARSPSYGALKESASNSSWREVVVDHIKRAKTVVVLFGDTINLRWELSLIESDKKTDCLILIIPPVIDPDISTIEAIFGCRFGVVPENQKLLVVVYSPLAKRVIGLTGSKANKQAYEVALSHALYLRSMT